jgi:hypothetical protein
MGVAGAGRRRVAGRTVAVMAWQNRAGVNST